MNANRVASKSVPKMPKGSTRGGIVIMFILVILFLLLIFSGYYLIVSCDPNKKKGFFDYLFDLEFNPCTSGIETPSEITAEEEQEYAARLTKREPEVFHISDQIYPYDQAACKCAAYGAELATKSQVIDAYNEGANWGTYGWSAGQQAFYPVQKDAYFRCLKRTDPERWYECRGPGVVGGRFKKGVRFGVNCFGIRPEGHVSIPKPTGPPTQEEVCMITGDYKSNHQLRGDDVSSFNRNKWSVYD